MLLAGIYSKKIYINYGWNKTFTTVRWLYDRHSSGGGGGGGGNRKTVGNGHVKVGTKHLHQ